MLLETHALTANYGQFRALFGGYTDTGAHCNRHRRCVLFQLLSLFGQLDGHAALIDHIAFADEQTLALHLLQQGRQRSGIEVEALPKLADP